MSPTKILWPAALLLLAAPPPAAAAITTYVGDDLMSSTSDPHPNSAAAAAAFDGAVSGAGLIDFESAPLGSFASLTLSGVTMTGADVNGADQSIRDTSNFPPGPTLDGYNTTPGGANFLEMVGGTLTFTFSNPVSAFGAYFSGVQTNFFSDVITFSDGSSQSVLIPADGTSSSQGALVFAGFSDPGAQIASITINAGNPNAGWDDIGVDDVRFAPGPVAGVPEPAAWTLMLFGFGGVGVTLRRRRRAVASLA